MHRRSSQLSNRPQPTPLSHSGKALLTRPTLPALSAPTANLLLAGLPEAEYQRLAPHVEPFALPRGLVLYETGTPLTHVYFPTGGIVSLLVALEDGASGQVAVVGNEGVVGVSLFMGGRSNKRAVVQSRGHAYRIRADYLMQEFERGGFLMNVLLRFAQSLITQMAQTAVCNRLHSIDQQLCRWLLLSLDRLSGDQINITQEQIANLLGVRRESITATACQLQKAGLISYRRGLITVLDRPTLEKRVCECFAVVNRETDRLLTPRAAVPPQNPDGLAASWPDTGHSEWQLRPQGTIHVTRSRTA